MKSKIIFFIAVCLIHRADSMLLQKAITALETAGTIVEPFKMGPLSAGDALYGMAALCERNIITHQARRINDIPLMNKKLAPFLFHPNTDGVWSAANFMYYMYSLSITFPEAVNNTHFSKALIMSTLGITALQPLVTKKLKQTEKKTGINAKLFSDYLTYALQISTLAYCLKTEKWPTVLYSAAGAGLLAGGLNALAKNPNTNYLPAAFSFVAGVMENRLRVAQWSIPALPLGGYSLLR